MYFLWWPPDLVVPRPDPAARAMTIRLEPGQGVDAVPRPPWDLNTVRQSLRRLDWWLNLDKRPRF